MINIKNKNFIVGVALVLSSELTFALVGALIKQLSNDVSAVQIIFFRNLFALIPLLPWLTNNRSTLFKTPHLKFHFLRSFTGLSAMFIYTYVLSQSTLVNGAMTLMLAPFFIPIIAYFWLKQVQSRITISSIIIGFIGVMLCLTTKTKIDAPSLQLGLGTLIVFGAILIAISKTTISRMVNTEPSKAIVAYFSIIGIGICGVMLPFAWKPISWSILLLLVTLGIMSSIGQLMMTKAFSKAGASTIGMFSYSSILFAAMLGALWWQEYPEFMWFVGASIIITAGYISIKYNRKNSSC